MPVLRLGDKELWSLTEAARRLGVTRMFLWRLVKSGRLAVVARISKAAFVAPEAAREAVKLFYDRKKAEARKRWWAQRKRQQQKAVKAK